jgi:hypothetical protein
MVAGQTPAIALNHLGFLPDSPKTFIFRVSGATAPTEVSLRDLRGAPKAALTAPLSKAQGDLGPCLIGEVSALRSPGLYQASAGGEKSVPFFVRQDLWRRTLPLAVSYHRAQRCGVAVPGVHDACHLDDARRRDSGELVDVTGGWHDAGDLRKWMTATMTNAFGLLYLARHLGMSWDPAGSGVQTLLEEVRWGNRYFLKMQDRDGLVWADTAGGLNGDNSDNRWSDNIVGNGDDRYINVSKSGFPQAMFTALQGLVANGFRNHDPSYSRECLAAGRRCWQAAKRESASPSELAFWLLAAIELHRASGDDAFSNEGSRLAARLIAQQAARPEYGQDVVRGYWHTSLESAIPWSDAVYSALPGLALLEAALAWPRSADGPRWRDAVRLYLDCYISPMASRSPYRILPYGLFVESPSPEDYRPLSGRLTYRYFMPVRKQFWWVGTTSHLLGHAALLGLAARCFHHAPYRHLAYRQMEWIMGANPFGACLMTGPGMRHPYPHSRFLGLIPGGIFNGIAGNVRDEPVLDTHNGLDWRTTEYWSPHNAFYLWACSLLDPDSSSA